MFQAEEKIRKNIVTPDGEDEFQINYCRDENVGALTTRSEKSYLILDSIDYWYDIIQKRYPPKQKCSCKNDYFKLCFDYVTRKGTDDYRAVELTSRCVKCGKEKKFAKIDIDYSPTAQLFEQPITYCKKPKIKYKTYSLKGYWKEGELKNLIEFLLQKPLLIYCWHWNRTEKKRYVRKLTAEELRNFLFVEKERYLSIYFSAEPLEAPLANSFSDDRGIYVDRDIWRKKEIIVLENPLLVSGYGDFYSMLFCSEYINSAGEVKKKDKHFCQLAQEFLAYSKKVLKK